MYIELLHVDMTNESVFAITQVEACSDVQTHVVSVINQLEL